MVECGEIHVVECFTTYRSRSSVGPWVRGNENGRRGNETSGLRVLMTDSESSRPIVLTVSRQNRVRAGACGTTEPRGSTGPIAASQTE